MNEDKLKSIIESILFAWGEPIKLSELSKVLNIKDSLTYKLLQDMKDDYLSEHRGLMLRKFNDTYQLKTKEQNIEFISILFKPNTRSNLSTAALETLSIIAYKQPVTKIEIDLIRGIKSEYIIRTLIDKKLIEVRGRLNKPGKPILYGTTNSFLAHFGLESLDDLPELKYHNELITSENESDLYEYEEIK